MRIETVAILMPGDMGHGCGIALRGHGLRVVSCLAGRSARTRGLAEAAAIEDLGSLEAVVRAADLILSIVPPDAAAAQARAVAEAIIAAECRPVYADCNAVSPATVREIGGEIGRAGAVFIDAGIVGRNPVHEKGRTRFYASGPDLAALEALDGRGIVVRGLGPEIGRASALKMIYASVSKGTFALHAAALTAAQALGLTEPYLAELDESRPAVREAMERMVPRIPLDAERWLAEMLEIAMTFEAAGVTRKLHDGAAEVMALAARTPIAAETRETVDTSRSLGEVLDMYVAATRKPLPPRA